jgi:hypothetical protein
LFGVPFLDELPYCECQSSIHHGCNASTQRACFFLRLLLYRTLLRTAHDACDALLDLLRTTCAFLLLQTVLLIVDCSFPSTLQDYLVALLPLKDDYRRVQQCRSDRKAASSNQGCCRGRFAIAHAAQHANHGSPGFRLVRSCLHAEALTDPHQLYGVSKLRHDLTFCPTHGLRDW